MRSKTPKLLAALSCTLPEGAHRMLFPRASRLALSPCTKSVPLDTLTPNLVTHMIRPHFWQKLSAADPRTLVQSHQPVSKVRARHRA
jgi:hypothetical protein